MSGNIVALRSYDFINANERKIILKNLNPNDTYLSILSDYQFDDWVWLNGFIENAPELKLLFKSRKAVNRTPDHGEDPRNTLYIFEISDEYKPKIIEQKEAFEKERKEKLIRFRELCKEVDRTVNLKAGENWHSVIMQPSRAEFNRLASKYEFNYHTDYKNAK